MKNILFVALLLCSACTASFTEEWTPAGDRIRTKWADEIEPEKVWQEYPRPQMVRERWQCLNGLWDYAVTEADATQMPSSSGKILVPFAAESSLSGVGRTIGASDALWYRTNISVPKRWKDDRILLHFDAVDWKCEVWVNGSKAGMHTGGYTAFAFDITPYLVEGSQEIVLKVTDGTDNGLQPRGKQVSDPKGIWYTAVTGVWQSVWMEPVSSKGHIADYKVSSDIEKGTITFTPFCEGAQEGDMVKIIISSDGKTVASSSAVAGESLTLKIDNPKLWSPDSPSLYDFRAELTRGRKVIDRIEGYTALRSIGVAYDKLGNKRMTLNGNILFHYGPLDQGWWPDGLYTAPCDEALRYDIEMTKKFGFNMIRKHIKVEPARWYMWCDRLGIMVWQDMPSISDSRDGLWGQGVLDENGHNFYNSGRDCDLAEEAKANYRKEWKEIISQLDKFQSIVVWVPFNEGWAQFETGGTVDFTRSLDSSRLINAASGGNWEKGQMGDILDSHHYPQPKMRLIDSSLVNVLGEYGGIGLPVEGHTWDTEKNWGYVKYTTGRELTDKYVEYAGSLVRIAGEGCAAAVYTQTTDVESEVNGLMTYDRKIVKPDIEKTARANHAVIKAGSDLALFKEDDFLQGCDKDKYSLVTIHGGELTMQITNFGARVITLWTPDRNGRLADVVVGRKSLAEYINAKGERFLGASPGPVANRIGNAEFTLDGTKYKLSANNGRNTLHGGFKGIDMLDWKIVDLKENSVTMEVVHPDGLDGFPGNKTISICFTLTEENEFRLDFKATTDKATPVNLAHHPFFNLRGCGNGTILDHIVMIDADANTPVDSELIPNGKIESLAGTPRDFRKPTAVGARVNDYSDEQTAFGHGYDHNFVLNRKTSDSLELAATVYEPEFGRYMEIITDQPGLQFYSGYFFDGSSQDKYGNPMSQYCSLVFETQKFPDAVNHENFPSIILQPGETYTHTSIYKFSAK